MAKKPIFHETQDFTSYVSGRCEERSRLSVSDSPPGTYFRLRLSFDWSNSGTREKNFKSRFHQRTQENCFSLLWGFSLWARWTKKHKLLNWRRQFFQSHFVPFQNEIRKKQSSAKRWLVLSIDQFNWHEWAVWDEQQQVAIHHRNIHYGVIGPCQGAKDSLAPCDCYVRIRMSWCRGWFMPQFLEESS